MKRTMIRAAWGILFLPLLILTLPTGRVQAAEEFTFISTEDLAKGIQEKTLTVVDANNFSVFEKNHIPTAIHVEYAHPDFNRLPGDKGAALVFYCKNPKCGASHEAARAAKGQGYTNVRVYPLGIDGWIAAGQSVKTGDR